MQISILSGIYSDNSAQLRSSYPVNYRPVPKENGVSAGFLRPSEGIKLHTAVTGLCRGGVNWKDIAYYVIGNTLYRINEDGTKEDLGNVGNDGKPVSFAFSFDRLGIASNNKMYYLKDDILSQVTDPDIGDVLDCVWLSGYFLTSDGEFIVQSELLDPTDINPFKYGSSEIDPDPIENLLINRNELYAVNRYTIEIYANTGGEYFAFSRITGAHIQKGAVGRKAACVYNEAIAFVGSGRKESLGVYLGENAQTVKLSTNEIDQILNGYTEAEQESIIVEDRIFDGHKLLYVHLPDRTLVYDGGSSSALGVPVWFVLTSAKDGLSAYRGRFFIRAYNKWLCGDADGAGIGYLTDDEANHFGEKVRMEFGTPMTWAETGAALIHELELIGLPGRSAFGKNPKISMSYSDDGMTWSVDRWVDAGKLGERLKRLVWRRIGKMDQMRVFRFRTDSDAFNSFMRLEAKVEPLYK